MQGRVATMAGPEAFEIKSFNLPEPSDGSLLLKVRRANICGSDIHQFHYNSPALKEGALGHELVAEVAALGAGVTKDNAGQTVKVGDRVSPVYYVTCRKCSRCLNGEFGMCANALREWSRNPDEAPHFFGAFGTHYYLNEDQYFYKVPDSLPDEIVAGANCGLAQMVYALDKSRLTAGSTLVIQGAGGIGLYAAAVANERAAQVIVIESVPDRIELARLFGVDEVIDMNKYPSREAREARVQELTNGQGADVVLEATGVAAAFPEAVALARVGGEILSVGNLNVGAGFDVPLSPGLITRKNLRIHGVLRYDPWYLHRALLFLTRNQHKYPFSRLTSSTYELDDLMSAIRDGESRSVARASVVFTEQAKD